MPANQKRLTKKQRRILKQQGILGENNVLTVNFGVDHSIKPMTDNQRVAFESWKNGYNLMLHGIAGTGKTFLALFFALKEVTQQSPSYKKVYIIRSTVPTRNQGFLPGSQRQKEAVYEEPYHEISTKIVNRVDSYEILKQKGLLEFRSTSFLRGVTLDDCIIVVDEVQNMSDGELHTIMTRVGENSKIIFCGDVKQDDLTSERYNEESGLKDFLKVIASMNAFKFVEFQIEDIVRSKLVKSYIIARDKLGL